MEQNYTLYCYILIQYSLYYKTSLPKKLIETFSVLIPTVTYREWGPSLMTASSLFCTGLIDMQLYTLLIRSQRTVSDNQVTVKTRVCFNRGWCLIKYKRDFLAHGGYLLRKTRNLIIYPKNVRNIIFFDFLFLQLLNFNTTLCFCTLVHIIVLV